MTAPAELVAWLAHRAGVKKLPAHPMPDATRALELNDRGDAFTAAFGQKEIRGFVGFVDLVGFSTRTKGLRPSEIGDYLRPFVTGVADAALCAGGLVDKTIGDELMIVVPDMEDDGGVPGLLQVGFLLGRLHDLQRELGPNYPFRIGLAYGLQFVDRFEGRGYAEWTIVGESVNLAKRLHSLPGAEPSDGIGGAFGVLTNETTEKTFQACLGFMAGFASRMMHRVLEGTVDLKGISPARCAILSPKVPAGEWRPGMRLD